MTDTTEHLDVVVIGAGLSGVGAGYRLQTGCPDRSYAILEARDAIGGTWDLFRYPGVRSDSDLFTLGYPFEPWTDAKAIADGPAILDYIRHTAHKHGIADHIRFRTRVVGADWSSAHAHWTLTLEVGQERRRTTMTCSFLYSCSGYYDYERPYSPALEGLEDFSGTVVHPQFWPADLDHAGRRVLVVGSGATAVTLVPALLRGEDAAASVTMLQRTPTWIAPVPSRDRFADRVRALLPARLAHRLIRTKNIAFTLGFYTFCRRHPARARRLLLRLTTRILGDEQLVADHFTPPYDPWDQRLCAAPDADFLKVVRDHRAEVVTDRIDRFVPEGVRLASGRVVQADLVITATGLAVQLFGGMVATVDGAPVPVCEQFVWQGTMITGLPNLAVCVGYTNASWTLRADLSSRLVCRVLNHLRERGLDSVVPVPEGDLVARPLLGLSSGYVQRSASALPRQGDRGVWRVRQNYPLDSVRTLRADLSRTLAGSRASDPSPRAEPTGAALG